MTRRGQGMFVSCRVGQLLLGIEIDRVQEINRLFDATFVPRAAPEVRGVINLRGSLVTVLDLARILDGGQTVGGEAARNVIIDFGEERIGLVVGAVGDVVDCRDRRIEPLPAHVERQHGRWFRGLVQLETELMLILDVDTVVAVGDERLAQAGRSEAR